MMMSQPMTSMEDAMSEPENGEEARRMRAVGDEQPDVPAPRAVVEHVLGRFNLTLARLDGGSNSGAYVAVPPWLVVLAMTVPDPVGEQRDYYDVYGFEDQVERDGDIEVQIFRWLYTLPSSIAMALWPVPARALVARAQYESTRSCGAGTVALLARLPAGGARRRVPLPEHE